MLHEQAVLHEKGQPIARHGAREKNHFDTGVVKHLNWLSRRKMECPGKHRNEAEPMTLAKNNHIVASMSSRT